MLEPLQMRAPSKRWLALASIVLVSTASLAWSFTRLRHTGQFLRWRPDRDALSCTYDQLDIPVRYDLAEVLAG